MKTSFYYTTVFILGTLSAFTILFALGDNKAEEDPNAYHFKLICLQEGNGFIKTKAYNKKENAVGAAQIRPIFLQDCNEQLKKEGRPTYTHKEMFDYDKAFIATQAYWRKYKLTTLEQRARSHCSGPDGPYQDNSLPYWKSLQQWR